jgi:hypothetical protein
MVETIFCGLAVNATAIAIDVRGRLTSYWRESELDRRRVGTARTRHN